MAKNKKKGFCVVPGNWGLIYASKEEAWDALFKEFAHIVEIYHEGNKSDATKFFQYWFDMDVVPYNEAKDYEDVLGD